MFKHEILSAERKLEKNILMKCSRSTLI